MTIALAQLNCMVGDMDGNAHRIIETINNTAADIIVFPELAISGYPPKDLLFRSQFDIHCQRALKKIIAHVKEKMIIVGYPEKIGDKIYNQACVIHHQKIIAQYSKQKLPNYAVFDEKRYFTAGDKPCVFESHGMKFGLVICEDVWHAEPISFSKKAGAEIIIAINASPFDNKHFVQREAVLQKRIAENHLPILYLNCVGGQDELVFDGGSMVFDAAGNQLQQAPFFKENILIVEIENKKIISKNTPEKNSPEKLMYGALKLGVHDYVTKNNFKGALIGLSGGIDSALTLAIAADALGADKVTAVIMPSQFTAKMSVEDAILEAKNLNVEYHIIEIDEIKKCFLEKLSPVFALALSGRASEGSLLQAQTNDKNTASSLQAQTNHKDSVSSLQAHTPHKDPSETYLPQAYTPYKDPTEMSLLQARTPYKDPSEARPDRASVENISTLSAEDTTEENLQARIRGMLLMAMANKFGKIVLTTGNKSEMAVGYATLYGDMAGGLAVIKDVYKTLVYKLAHYRNSISEVIPQRVITRAPSAELKHNQTDQDKLPPYEILDKILEKYIEENKDAEDIIDAGFNATIVHDVIRMIQLSEYKRRQSAIGIRVTSRAFGRDWRVPVTAR